MIINYMKNIILGLLYIMISPYTFAQEVSMETLFAQEIENIRNLDNTNLHNITMLNIFGGGHFPLPRRYYVSSVDLSQKVLSLASPLSILDEESYILALDTKKVYGTGIVKYASVEHGLGCFEKEEFNDWEINSEEVLEYTVDVYISENNTQFVCIYDKDNVLFIADDNRLLWQASLEFFIKSKNIQRE